MIRYVWAKLHSKLGIQRSLQNEPIMPKAQHESDRYREEQRIKNGAKQDNRALALARGTVQKEKKVKESD